MAERVQGADALRKRFAAIGNPKTLLGKVALLGVKNAKQIARTDFTKTAALERTIRVGTVTERDATIIAGGTNGVGYAEAVEKGTGIYGPRKRKIVPRRAKVLAWKSGGSRLTGRGKGSTWHFARSVKGRKATPYLKPGAQDAIHDAGVEVVVKLWNDAA